MDPVANPYRPGAGRRPPLLAGRQGTLDSFDAVRRRAQEWGEGDRSWVLHGLRGVGKTVLLGEMLRQVSGPGWISAKVEAGGSTPLPVALSRALVRGLRTATGRHAESRLRRLLGVFRSFSLSVDPSGGVGIDVAPVGGVADSGRFADDLAALLEELGTTARELGTGVLLLVDELQEASAAELSALNAAVHQLGQADVPLPLVVVGAGLPSLPVALAEASSYAERLYEYRAVRLLDADASREALLVPADERGVAWTASALDEAVGMAGGYPYFLQAVGKHVWDNARRSPIEVDDVHVGLREARREIDDGLYRVRWERASPAQRDLLRALATLGGAGSATVADIARALGRPRVSDLSVARVEVIRKGLVYAPERGRLAFTVPGMDEFIARQP